MNTPTPEALVPLDLIRDLIDYGQSGKVPEPSMVERLEAALAASKAEPSDDGTEQFASYLKECDGLAIQPDVAGAFHAGWTRRAAASKAEAAGGEAASDEAVGKALEYLHPHLEAGTFAAPDWAIQLASILTGGDGCGSTLAASKAEACDMGELCIGCEPRNADGRCPDAASKVEAVTMSNDGNSEADFIAHHADACPSCGGSGHKDDVRQAAGGEAVAWTEERLRVECARRGWYMREGASVPTADGDWRHPFDVTIGSRDLCRFLAALSAPAVAVEPVEWSVLQIGNQGAAYDPAGTHRAFTYDRQPGNIDASRLGRAAVAASKMSAGDSIDGGLGLLKALQSEGFGVFQIGTPTQPAAGAVPEAAPAGEGFGVKEALIQIRDLNGNDFMDGGIVAMKNIARETLAAAAKGVG